MAIEQALRRRGIFYGWSIVGVATLVNFAAFPTGINFVAVFLQPMSDELGLGRPDLAWALTIRVVIGALVGLVLGRFVDRHGTRWLGAATGLVAAICISLLYFSNSLWFIFLVFGISGLAGFGSPGGALLTVVPVAKWFATKRGRALSILTAGSAFGSFLGFPLAAYLIDRVGWRTAWLIVGILMAILIVPAYALLMRRDPEDMGLHPDGAAQPHSGSGVNIAARDFTLAQAVRSPVLWAILIGQGAVQFAVSGLNFYRVAYWQEQGLSRSFVSWGLAIDPLIVVFSGLFFGWLAERVSIRVIGTVGALGWPICMLPMMFYVSGHPYFLYLYSVPWAILAGCFVTFTNMVWPAYFGRRHLGAIRGALLPVTVAAGALGSPLYGYLIDGWGYFASFVLGALMFAAAGVIYLFCKPPPTPLEAPAPVALRSA